MLPPEGWSWLEDECCNHCGDAAMVKTAAPQGYFYDDEEVMCCNCRLYGYTRVEEDGEGWINWHDELDCTCNWCNEHRNEF